MKVHDDKFISAMVEAGWTPVWVVDGEESRVKEFKHRNGRVEEWDSAYRFWEFTRGKMTIMPW